VFLWLTSHGSTLLVHYFDLHHSKRKKKRLEEEEEKE
jgi:hypothetical protein